MPATSTRLYRVLLPISAASSSAWDRPVVADQKPTTGTSATTGGVGIGVGVVATCVGFGSCVGEGGWVAIVALVGFGFDGGDGWVGAQDTRMAAIAAAPMHRRSFRDPSHEPSLVPRVARQAGR